MTEPLHFPFTGTTPFPLATGPGGVGFEAGVAAGQDPSCGGQAAASKASGDGSLVGPFLAGRPDIHPDFLKLKSGQGEEPGSRPG
jgi:hypothetical protein